jgi:hypothetical protein
VTAAVTSTAASVPRLDVKAPPPKIRAALRSHGSVFESAALRYPLGWLVTPPAGGRAAQDPGSSVFLCLVFGDALLELGGDVGVA